MVTSTANGRSGSWGSAEGSVRQVRGTGGIGSRSLRAGTSVDLDPTPVAGTSVRPPGRLAPAGQPRSRALGSTLHIAQTAQSPTSCPSQPSTADYRGSHP